MPFEVLKLVTSPWPFALWGMDIVGPLPDVVAHKKFMLVATYYFSKWVETEAYVNIKGKCVSKFVWKNIVWRYEIPQAIIVEYEPQFDNITFRPFRLELKINFFYSTLRYPQSNGQVEATNKTLLSTLKKRLEKAKGMWVDELLGVLWAYQTTPGRPMGSTPFALTYGMNAVIPMEIGMPIARTVIQGQRDEIQELQRHLDWADEARGNATIRMASYHQRPITHYN